MNFTFQRVELQDIGDIKRVYKESVLTLGIPYYTKEQLWAWVGRWEEKNWMKRINEQYFIKAVNEKKEIMGFVSANMDGYIDLLFVLPQDASKGLGRALLDHILNHTTYIDTALYTHASHVALPLFIKMGFIPIRKHRLNFDGIELTNHSMRRDPALKRIGDNFISQLKAFSNDKKARWLENYVKHNVKSIGVGIPTLRSQLHNFRSEYKVEEWEQVSYLLNEWMRHELTEAKLSAILFVQVFGKGWEPEQKLHLIELWLEQKWVSDWNVCDWMCVRLLSPLLDDHPEECMPYFDRWVQKEYVWQARAGLVPFAQAKSIETHRDSIISYSEILIQREERFCKTAVGWVLREISRFDGKGVKDFLNRHGSFVTTEVKKNAMKYL